MLAVRRLSASYSRGKLTVEAGKQFVRWGKTDVLNPTDRFAPRDFLNVVDTEFLGDHRGAGDLWDAGQHHRSRVVAEADTESRAVAQSAVGRAAAGNSDRGGGAAFPGGPQFGARWNHIGTAVEYSFSFYNGYDHLPLYDTQLEFAPFQVDALRIRNCGCTGATPPSRCRTSR